MVADLSLDDIRQVQEAVEAALLHIQSHGKAAGILTSDQALARRYLELGAAFVAVGHNVGLLVGATSRLAAELKGIRGETDTTVSKTY